MAEEKRLHPRIDFHIEIIIKGRKEINKTLNFSTGGAFIQTIHPSGFDSGEAVDLVTKLPLESEVMRLKAKVAHVDKQGIGIQFVDLWGSQAEAIENHFGVFKATIPLANPT